MITIVDYGMGNLGSIQNMFKRIGVSSEITSKKDRIAEATKILLPGVGAFDAAMERMDSSGLIKVLSQKVLEEKIPVLGICLGMQLLTESSEEGLLPGLGWINARTIKFKINSGLKVPHMGWNLIKVQQESPLLANLPAISRFYFVHSYHVQAHNPENVLTTTPYGLEFHSIIQKDNIYGAQFHPEKSHKYGMAVLKNFANL